MFGLAEHGFLELEKSVENPAKPSIRFTGNAAATYLTRAKKASKFEFSQSLNFWMRSAEAFASDGDADEEEEEDVDDTTAAAAE